MSSMASMGILYSREPCAIVLQSVAPLFVRDDRFSLAECGGAAQLSGVTCTS